MEAGTGRVDNLAMLPTLDERALIEELKVRYSREIIYVSSGSLLTLLSLCRCYFECINGIFVLQTFIGDILIAVNPYQALPIYGPEVSL